jgi:hypothetical protein
VRDEGEGREEGYGREEGDDSVCNSSLSRMVCKEEGGEEGEKEVRRREKGGNISKEREACRNSRLNSFSRRPTGLLAARSQETPKPTSRQSLVPL